MWAAGKQFHFTHLSMDDGLSHNDITSIVQDKDGFMWFATRDGLNRYDGNKVKVYRHKVNGRIPFTYCHSARIKTEHFGLVLRVSPVIMQKVTLWNIFVKKQRKGIPLLI